jgi:small-conductance mechanosensitive channel
MDKLKELFESVREGIAGVDFANPLIGAATALAVVLITIVLLYTISALTRRALALIERWRGSHIRSLSVQQQEILSADEISKLLSVTVKGLGFVLSAFVVASAIAVVLGLFAWTERIARAAFDMAVATVSGATAAVVAYIPNLFLIAFISAITWYLVRLVRLLFDGIQSERIRVRRFYPEWAMPTFNIIRILIIVFALVMIFPYLPGASSPAFQGVSIFIGVLLSLGSTSAVANVVAGVVITYMRAFKIGDRVRIAETEGIVIERSLFVTRLRTTKNVEIAIPNSQIMGNHIVNFSSLARDKGVMLHTSVGIGYDVDWRRVHELLLAAARETEGVAEKPEPFVHQKELGDFAVVYELNVPTNQAHRIPALTSELHARILDQFNRAGVEIMSPDYAALRDGNSAAIPEGLPAS